MNKKIVISSLAIFFLILAIFWLRTPKKNGLAEEGIKEAPKEAISYEAKEASLGEVAITVIPTVLSLGQKPEFEVEFNTHSVELDFDVSKVATLSYDGGNVFKNPLWEGSAKGGHHRNGKLVFQEELSRETGEIRLTFRGISEEEVAFSWII